MKDKNMAVLGIGTAQALGFIFFDGFPKIQLISYNLLCPTKPS